MMKTNEFHLMDDENNFLLNNIKEKVISLSKADELNLHGSREVASNYKKK